MSIMRAALAAVVTLFSIGFAITAFWIVAIVALAFWLIGFAAAGIERHSYSR